MTDTAEDKVGSYRVANVIIARKVRRPGLRRAICRGPCAQDRLRRRCVYQAMSFLGLDVGGSKCRYEWWPSGSLPGGDAPTARPSVDGVEVVVDALAGAIEAAVVDGRVPAAVVGCVAGLGDRARANEVASALRARVDAPIAIVGDGLAAAAAGLADGPGLMLWSGTGSFAIARSEAGELFRIGGRGYAFGDEGSGYDLVRRAIVGVLRAVDGRGRETLLSDSLTRAFDAPSPSQLGAVAQRLAPGEVAARLPIVLEAFEADDWLAADVLMLGMRQLVEQGEVAMRRAGLEAADGVRVALGGGVLGSKVLRDGLLQVLQAALGGAVEARILDPDAAARGAAWLAGGWQAGEEPQRAWVEDVTL